MSLTPGPLSQRGAALLVALLAAALAAMLATTLVERSQRDLARTVALIDAERAWQLAGGLEGMARDWIRQQLEAGPGRARLDGQWSEPFPVPGGVVRGRVFALDGKFNLNALADRDPGEAAAARRSLEALLAGLHLEPELADSIAGLYTSAPGLERLRLAHFSELARLESMPRAALQTLGEHVVVLPDPAARINVNRTSPEVLAAVIEGLSVQQARSVLERVPYPSLDELLGQPAFDAVNPARARARLSVESRWYLTQARVRLGSETRNYFRVMSTGGSGYDFRYLSLGIP